MAEFLRTIRADSGGTGSKRLGFGARRRGDRKIDHRAQRQVIRGAARER
jgi:hypothetical protein